MSSTNGVMERWRRCECADGCVYVVDAEQMSSTNGLPPQTAPELLESAAIYWRRDFDALAAGVVLGVLLVLALMGLFG